MRGTTRCKTAQVKYKSSKPMKVQRILLPPSISVEVRLSAQSVQLRRNAVFQMGQRSVAVVGSPARTYVKLMMMVAASE